MKRYMKTTEAAVYLSTSPSGIRRLVYGGLLKPVRFFRGFRFPVEQLDEFMKQHAR